MRGDPELSQLELAQAELRKFDAIQQQAREVVRAVSQLRALEWDGPDMDEAEDAGVRDAARALAELSANMADPEGYAEAVWRSGGAFAIYNLVRSLDLELCGFGLYVWAASADHDGLRRELLPSADIAARVLVALAAIEAPAPRPQAAAVLERGRILRPASAAPPNRELLLPAARAEDPAAGGRQRLLLATLRIVHAYCLDFDEPPCVRQADVQYALRRLAAGPRPLDGAVVPPLREAARSLQGPPLFRLLARSALKALRSLSAKQVERAESGRRVGFDPPPPPVPAGPSWGHERALAAPLLVQSVGAAGFRAGKAGPGAELLRGRLAPPPPPPEEGELPPLLGPLGPGPLRPHTAASPLAASPALGPSARHAAAAERKRALRLGVPNPRPASARPRGPGGGPPAGHAAPGTSRVESQRLANAMRRLHGSASAPGASPLWRVTS